MNPVYKPVFQLRRKFIEVLYTTAYDIRILVEDFIADQFFRRKLYRSFQLLRGKKVIQFS
jgi:hypothetical protein